MSGSSSGRPEVPDDDRGALTDEEARQTCEFDWLSMNRAELVLYNLRHVQHHAAQLNLILRQTTDSAPRWVKRATKD